MKSHQLRNPMLQTALFFLFFITNLCQFTVLQSQPLPPAKQDGFVYKNYPVGLDTITIQAFFDPVCPDSRDSWPPLRQALDHYGSRVRFSVHLLPLPYHDHAFVTSRALHIVNGLNTNATFPLLEAFFKYQERFYNAPTRNMSRKAVVDKIVKFADKALGNSYYSALKSGFLDSKTDLHTRISFKYSTSKGVYGTPTFYVNGFVLQDTNTILDYKGWRSLIDGLIKAQTS